MFISQSLVAFLAQVLFTLMVMFGFVYIIYGQFLASVDMLIIVYVQGLFLWIVLAVLSSWWLSEAILIGRSEFSWDTEFGWRNNY